MAQPNGRTAGISGVGVATVAASLAATVATAYALKPVLPWVGDITRLAGDDLTWLANLLAVGTGITTMAGLLRRRLSHLGAVNAQLEKESAGRLDAISDLTIEKEALQKESGALAARLAETALAQHARETRDGNSERAVAALRRWTETEGADVAAVLHTLANWTAAHAVGELRPPAYCVARAYAAAVEIFAGPECAFAADAREMAADLALLQQSEGLPAIPFAQAAAALIDRETELRLFDADKVLWAQRARNEANRLTAMRKSHLSLPLIERAVHLLRRELGPNAFQTLAAEVQLAIDLRWLGRYEEALALIDSVVAREDAVVASGVALPDPTRARQERVAVLRFMGRYSEALPEIDVVIAALGDEGDEYSSGRLAAKYERASLLRWTGHAVEALAEVDAIIEALTDRGVSRHDNLLLVSCSLRAVTLRFLCRFEDALAEVDAVIAILNELQLPFHSELLVAKHERAAILRNVGRQDEALAAIDDAIACKIANPAMGPWHLETLSSRYERAYILEMLERLTEGLAEIEALLAAVSRNPAMAAYRRYYLGRRASLLRKLGRKEEALAEIDAELMELEADPSFGPDHDEVVFARTERARILEELAR